MQEWRDVLATDFSGQNGLLPGKQCCGDCLDPDTLQFSASLQALPSRHHLDYKP